MRKKTEFKRISVTRAIYDRIQKDKKRFQRTINGGKWSISDTIQEYQKVLDTSKSVT